jgi:hypothetical protein
MRVTATMVASVVFIFIWVCFGLLFGLLFGLFWFVLGEIGEGLTTENPEGTERDMMLLF